MSRVTLGSQAVVGKLERRFASASEAYAARRTWKNPKAKKAFLYHMQQVSREAFQLLRSNVAVGGSPWDYTLKDDDTAPRDRDLSAQLKAIQLEVYELISRVTQHRAQTPQAIDAKLAECPPLEVPTAEAIAKADETASAPTAAGDTAAPSEATRELLDRLAKAMDEIAELSRTLPQRKAQLHTLARALEIQTNNLMLPDESEEEGSAQSQQQEAAPATT
ncbi:hypothetical protein PTSG_00423 [Salpingoeca rosetta]|uniref:Uncharacterized protein n=1 Tax=Salpingoeca rosetta (strain ATCC 50818 / BSB-021) TaxID=946362 RepID=F2TWF7_SALR5|nr:uncharacterized protein PTSG_00423 [Salpingoeca rosetta]EGD72403.1 hypothetical protein PTSG_00423 [Salpingoeca rosetta]|eukprot:XP_004998972.1 hypothetical protein PTSG_00423 [Salpingoeca rosetta]